MHCVAKLKLLKKDRARLNRTTQGLIQVRSYFKSSFYDEIIGDTKKALKHSQRALDFLGKEPIPVDPARLIEFKVVAELIVLRVSRMLLAKNDVSGACERLLKMVHDYKQRMGPESLVFQHYAWLAHVHESFGRLMEHSVAAKGPEYPAGLENPGSFFQAAAHYTALRRAAAIKRRNRIGTSNLPSTEALPETPSRLDVARQRFVGQPYEEFQHPLEQQKVVERSIQPDVELAKELNVQHSELIISLLHRAYKFNRGPLHRRRQLQIAASLADEHFLAGAFDLALKYYAEISHARGLGLWSKVLQHVRLRATECARNLNLSVDFVLHSLDWLSCTSGLQQQQQRETLYQEVVRQLNTLTDPDCVTLDLHLSSVLQVNARWSKKGVLPFEEPVALVASIKSHFPVPCTDLDLTVEVAGLFPNGVTKVETVRIESLAPEKDVVVAMSFGASALPLARISVVRMTCMAFGGKLVMQMLGSSSAAIVPDLTVSGRPSLVSLLPRHVPSVWLENDVIPLSVTVQVPVNEREILKSSLSIEYLDAATGGQTLTVASDGVVPVYLLTSKNHEPVPRIVIEEPIKPGGQLAISFALRVQTFGEQLFFVRFDYETSEYAASSKLAMPVKIHKPFHFKFQLLRDSMQPLSRNALAWTDRSLLVATTLENCCDVPVCVTDVTLVVEDEQACVRTTGHHQFQLGDCVLHPRAELGWCESLLIKASRAALQTWAHLVVSWRNDTLGESACVVQTRVALPQFASAPAPFVFSLEAPSTAGLGEAFDVTVKVVNHSGLSHQMVLFARERQAQQSYVLDGMKNIHFRMLPHTSWETKYRVISLVAGELPLPAFVIKSKRDNSTVEGSEKGVSVTIKKVIN